MSTPSFAFRATRSLVLAALALTTLASSACTSRGRREPPATTGTDATASVDAGASDTTLWAARDAGFEPLTDAAALDATTIPTGRARSMEIYSGDGQLVIQGFPGGDDMKVLVLDDAGLPVANVLVTWTVTRGGMAVTGPFSTGTTGTSRTNARGIAHAGLRGEFLAMIDSAVPSEVTATSEVGTLTFRHVTAYVPSPPLTPTQPQIELHAPEARDLGTMTRGSVAPGALVSVAVPTAGTLVGRGFPGIATRFFVGDFAPDADEPSPITCANATVGLQSGGLVYSDERGEARCDVRAPSTPGDYVVGVSVGGVTSFAGVRLRVE
jgi:hypothetical protein